MKSPSFRQPTWQICRAVGYTKGAQQRPGQRHAWKQRCSTRETGCPSPSRMLWSNGSQQLSCSELRRGPGLLSLQSWHPHYQRQHSSVGRHNAGDSLCRAAVPSSHQEEPIWPGDVSETRALGLLKDLLQPSHPSWTSELLSMLCVAIPLLPVSASRVTQNAQVSGHRNSGPTNGGMS